MSAACGEQQKKQLIVDQDMATEAVGADEASDVPLSQVEVAPEQIDLGELRIQMIQCGPSLSFHIF